MAFTFDAANKLVIIPEGTTSLPLATLWTEWKDWIRAGNAGKGVRMDYIGGEIVDPSTGKMIPLFLFLLDGLRIRPYEGDHTLTVTGGTLVGTAGGDPFVSTLGDYTVRIRYEQPAQVLGYSTSGSGGSSSEIAAAVVAALKADGSTLTVEKFLGLK